MSAKWKLGDMARVALMGGPRWSLIIKHDPTGKMHTVLCERGHIDYLSDNALLTKDEYLKHCEYMRDDWTGTEYRKYREMAEREFVPPPKWEEWLNRATART